jgi:hypothetical protein
VDDGQDADRLAIRRPARRELVAERRHPSPQLGNILR